MKSFLLLLIFCTFSQLVAQENQQKKPRDKYVKPVEIKKETAVKLIESIQNCRDYSVKKDYEGLYLNCVHPKLRSRVRKEVFVKQMLSVHELILKFFESILQKYKEKGHLDKDFQIGSNPNYDNQKSLMIQFSDIIDSLPEKSWPTGDPIRIEFLKDADVFKFYDID